MRRSLPFLLVVLLLALLAGCGDDDDGGGGEAGSSTSSTTSTSTSTEEEVPPVPVEDACALVPDAAGASGLDLGPGVPDGDERRRTCAFSATEPGQVGLTVAVQAGGRFDDKAAQSEASLGTPGQPVDDLGDRALFFYSDEDLPEGVGGVLVEVGDLTLEVTLQGLAEDPMREAATALAELAVSNV